MQTISLTLFSKPLLSSPRAAHFGVLIGGYEHLKAGTAESCIGAGC